MKNFLSEIKSQVKILDLIRHYLPLVKKGKGHWAVCPFHSDSSPSLSVSSEKNIFKCFACGVAGDAITFVMKYENLNIIDAAKKISQIFNLNFHNQFENSSANKLIQKKNKFFKLNEIISELYKQSLFQENEQYLNYLIEERKLNLEIIKKFELGFCPSTNIIQPVIEKWNNLNPNNSFSFFDLQEVGQLIKNRKGEDFLFLANRIIFPIFDEKRNITGFAGRSILPTEKIKYLNVGENIAFKKSENLFNVQNLQKNSPVYLFEGYLDLISSDKIGFNNCIALMGLSLSSFQLDLIKKYSDKLIFCLDNDEAGQTNLLKFAKKAINFGFFIEVIDFLDTNYKDIDSYIVNEEEKAYQVLKKPINFFDWFKKFFVLKNSKITIETIKTLCNTFLSWFFSFVNDQIIFNSNISIDYAQESIKKIFSFYDLCDDETIKDIVKKNEQKYLNLIVQQSLNKTIINEKASEQTTIKKETNIEKQKEEKNLIIFANLIFLWIENKEAILEKFLPEEWFIEWKQIFLVDSEDTLEFFKDIQKVMSLNNLQTEEKEKILNNYEKYRKNDESEDVYTSFFQIYFLLIQVILNRQIIEINQNLSLSFSERVNKKNQLEDLIKKNNQNASQIFKKILLFKKEK